jgi:Glycoside-hydrolase family GH114
MPRRRTRHALLAALAAALALLAVAGVALARGGPTRHHHRHAPSPPPAHARFSYQIGGSFSPQAGTVVDRDRTSSPARGHYDICYVNAFQTQSDEAAWWRSQHPDLLLSSHGSPVIDQSWGEVLLDTSTPAKRQALLRIVGGWIDGCARAGFQAVEPDNLDSWSRSQGLLTQSDNLAFAALLIRRAHQRGLAIAQKNASEVASQGRRLGFDFAIAEECQAYNECDAYTQAYGRHVIEIEYTDNGGESNFQAACAARGSQISIVLRDRDVTPAGDSSYVEQWC